MVLRHCQSQKPTANIDQKNFNREIKALTFNRFEITIILKKKKTQTFIHSCLLTQLLYSCARDLN